MYQSTRRGFLALTSAGVAAAAVAPTARATGSEHAAAGGSAPGDPMVAYVHDATTGEVAVMVGEREVLVRDRALVAQLARHLRS